MAVASVALLLLNRWLIFLVVPVALFAVFKASVLYVTTRLNYDMRWYVITAKVFGSCARSR